MLGSGRVSPETAKSARGMALGQSNLAAFAGPRSDLPWTYGLNWTVIPS